MLRNFSGSKVMKPWPCARCPEAPCEAGTTFPRPPSLHGESGQEKDSRCLWVCGGKAGIHRWRRPGVALQPLWGIPAACKFLGLPREPWQHLVPCSAVSQGLGNAFLAAGNSRLKLLAPQHCGDCSPRKSSQTDPARIFMESCRKF